MMGQAAGTAAVQSMKSRKSAAELDMRELIHTLRKNGAKLPQKKLNEKITCA